MRFLSGSLIGLLLVAGVVFWGWVGYSLLFGDVYYLIVTPEHDPLPEWRHAGDADSYETCMEKAAFWRGLGAESVRCEEVPAHRHWWNIVLNLAYQANLIFGSP